jgi:L,D-transpeptidase catalytic domain
MRRLTLAAAAAALLAACPATAAAQAQAPAITLAAQGTLASGHHRVALRGEAFTATGTVAPYVAGDRVIVTVYRNGRKLSQRTVALAPAPGGTAGAYALRMRARRTGRYVLQAIHLPSAGLGRIDSRPVKVYVVRPYVHPGSRGVLVRLLQDRLARLHYVVPRSGVYDSGTGLAVLTWRKVAHMARTMVADEAVFRGLLAGRGRFHVRHPRDGHHVEARLDLQVLALIDHGHVQRLYHTSSGKNSTPTVRGRFRVYVKAPGFNSEGMYDSSYFFRGYAIHGYASVPTFPASHGCLRVPMRYAPAIFDWVRIGDVVWVES